MSDKIFLDGLFERYYQMLDEEPFSEEKDVVRRIKFIKTSRVLKIIIWVGDRKPIPAIRYSIKVYPDEKTNKLVKPGRKAILFGLNIDSLVYANSKKLFITFFNAYLKVCSEKQYNKLLLPFEEGGMFCFNMYQDSPDSKPYCYAYIKTSSLLSGIYIETVENCPEGYITCEMTDSFSGYFLYVNKEVIITGEELTKEDVMQVD